MNTISMLQSLGECDRFHSNGPFAGSGYGFSELEIGTVAPAMNLA